MPEAVCRAIRLIAIVGLLGRRGHSVTELAERFGVSVRTIQRDLLDLQAAPLYVPIMDEEEHRYKIEGHYSLN